MTTYNLIKEAILSKKCVTCEYNGYTRKMAPHVIGTKKGKQQALFYQYGGESSSGLSTNPNDNWRCVPIDKIVGLIINKDPFETATNHSGKQTCVDDIDVEVDY